ncbi:ATP-binding cassette domain-containing protein [Actinokineospora terrae]|uniref:UvrABC system protein A n=1 Tax=Actinokineospora terrae TaxID=155974 RepID=A0A1H9KXH5_9PSEU|nr:excinuclease ABC subunit UvrA [Actinokineospora terrae]SER03758.1 excinuclease ABC, A subunit [Actinokineospora terrae]
MNSARPPLVVHDARTNNLTGVTVSIPSPALTVVTGVSGSGKSSLVFETIAKESQRQLNEVFPLFIRNRLPKFERPDFERMENLAPAIVVDQRNLGRSARSTVGTLTEVHAMLRVLFSRHGKPSAGESTAYSFNAPDGMCPECEGLGEVLTVEVDLLLDKTKSLNEGAITHPNFAVGTNYWKRYATAHYHVEQPAKKLGKELFDADKPVKDYTKDELELLLYGSDFQTDRLDDLGNVAVNDYEGLVDRFTRRFVKPGLDSLKPNDRKHVEPLVDKKPCRACKGTRLAQAVLKSRIDGHNIADLSALQVTDLIDVLRKMEKTIGDGSVLRPPIAALTRMDEVGLGYLSLDRSSLSLSGGEGQRLKTVRHLGSSLTGMTYVFDEPSVGLHPRDVERLITLLHQLRDKGNIVLVVEHNRAVIEAADHVIDIGPGAGARGGSVTFEGTAAALAKSDTVTGRELRKPIPEREPREFTEHLKVRKASLHNLRNVDADFPLGVLTVVTGVAGSGKSTLATKVLPRQHPDVVVIDQSAVGINPRSTPATYAKIWDHIRTLFAREHDVKPGLFSFNAEGGCPTCKGRGTITSDMAYLDPVTVVCETCGGRRFDPAVLAYKVGGRSIADVLETTIEEAVDQFSDETVTERLKAFLDVGLGYLTLGRSLSELSGGERQRVKLASRLTAKGSVIVFDEPTSGLHMADVRHLVDLFDRIIDAGNTVIVIEHDLDVVKVADWVIDLGPGAGSEGGEIVFTGVPADLAKQKNSLTGRHLAKERS